MVTTLKLLASTQQSTDTRQIANLPLAYFPPSCRHTCSTENTPPLITPNPACLMPSTKYCSQRGHNTCKWPSIVQKAHAHWCNPVSAQQNSQRTAGQHHFTKHCMHRLCKNRYCSHYIKSACLIIWPHACQRPATTSVPLSHPAQKTTRHTRSAPIKGSCAAAAPCTTASTWQHSA